MALTQITTGSIADDAVTTDKLANAINTARDANTAKTTNATHSGEVTGATALTIADNVVDEANLKVSNSPTNGYFLSAQSGNTGGLTWAQVSTDLSNDSSPQLGGDLDTNSHHILLDDNHSIKFGDNADAELKHDGSSNLQIRFSDASTSVSAQVPPGIRIVNTDTTEDRLSGIYFTNGHETGNVGIFAQTLDTASASTGEGSDMWFYTKRNGQSLMAARAKFTNYGHFEPASDSTYNLGSSSSRWLNAYIDNVYCDTLALDDNDKIKLGNGNDLQLYHNGADSIITNATGNLYVQTASSSITLQRTNGEKFIIATSDGSVALYHDNAKKFETKSWGCEVTGQLHATGSVKVEDSAELQCGASADLKVFHNGSHSYIEHGGTGDLYAGTTSASSGQNIRLMTNSTTRFSIISTGHFVPYANNTYDIGTSSYRVRNIYTNDLNLSNEGSSNEVDGTWGSYTIQEGSEDLFLINKRNGKKYKFNLTEVL